MRKTKAERRKFYMKTIFGTFLLVVLVLGSLGSVVAMTDIDLRADARVNALDRVEMKEKARVNLDSDSRAKIRAYQDARIERFKDLRARSVSDISAETESEVELESEDSLEDVIVEIDAEAEADLKASSFAVVSAGAGWVTNSEDGHFLRVLFAEKEFTDEETGETTLRSKGVIKVGNQRTYKLNLESYSDSEIEFDVMTRNNEVVGTLVLSEEKNLNGFRVWTGTFDSGEAEWSVDLATRTSRTRGSIDSETDVEVRGQGNGRGLGFFARLRSFFSAN